MNEKIKEAAMNLLDRMNVNKLMVQLVPEEDYKEIAESMLKSTKTIGETIVMSTAIGIMNGWRAEFKEKYNVTL